MTTLAPERKLRKDDAVGTSRIVRGMSELSPFLIPGYNECFLWVKIQKEDGMRRRLCYVVSLKLHGATALLVRKVPKIQVRTLAALKGTRLPEWPGIFSESLPVYLVKDAPPVNRVTAAGSDMSPTLLCVGCLSDGR